MITEDLLEDLFEFLASRTISFEINHKHQGLRRWTYYTRAQDFVNKPSVRRMSFLRKLLRIQNNDLHL